MGKKDAQEGGGGNGVRGGAPAKFLKVRFYPASGPRGGLSIAFLSSSRRDLSLGEVW